MRIKNRIKVKMLIFLVVVLALSFNFLGLVNASRGLGIRPGLIDMHFQPGYKFSVDYEAWGGGNADDLEIFATGDFAEYVKFSKSYLKLPGSFTAYIALPEEAKKYGKNYLYIRVSEPDLTAEEKFLRGGINTRLALGALILIRVPYPGKYAEIEDFEINSGNAEDSVFFNLVVRGAGEENVFVKSNAEVFKDGQFLEKIDFGSKIVQPKKKSLFRAVRYGNHYEPGDYDVTAFIEFEDVILNETKVMRIGTMFVDILDWTREFNKSQISPFSIEVESKWANSLNNTYATVSITDDVGLVFSSFKTLPLDLGPWKKELKTNHTSSVILTVA
jgi:hypothetical protein